MSDAAELKVLRLIAPAIVSDEYVKCETTFRDLVDSFFFPKLERECADFLRQEIAKCPGKWFFDHYNYSIVYVGSELVTPVDSVIGRFSFFDSEETVYAIHWGSCGKERIRWTPFTSLYRVTRETSVFVKEFFLPGESCFRYVQLKWVCFPSGENLSLHERGAMAAGLLGIPKLLSAKDELFVSHDRSSLTLKRMSFEAVMAKYCINKK